MADSIVMTEHERAAFLRDVHTGIISIPDGDRGPLAVPIWYRVDDDGDVVVLTPATSRKARLCAVGTRVSLTAQTEELPPKYVSVEGPVVSIEPSDVDELTVMAARYLGDEIGAAYVEMTRGSDDDVDEVQIRMRPERWFSGDFAKRH
ncbi:MAG: pyridoxamine 5'-phosphate oxidase family protein, partial [Acidimicrobiia bacterium]|nr:pyridoxamine 5'-phosphate oxidase family protein [Acidimicrobiia bacterium]